MAPDTGSSEVRPGRPSFLASDCFSSRAISHLSHLPQLLDLARCRPAPRRAGGRFRRASLAMASAMSVSILIALLGGGVLRAAEPAGRRDRADVGQHRLVAARAAQLVHLVAVRCGRTNSRCGRDARGRGGAPAPPAPRSRRRGSGRRRHGRTAPRRRSRPARSARSCRASRCSDSAAMASEGMLPSCQLTIMQLLGAVLRGRGAGLDDARACRCRG